MNRSKEPIVFKANLVHAVSVGSLREITFGGKMVTTAIFKAPVDGPFTRVRSGFTEMFRRIEPFMEVSMGQSMFIPKSTPRRRGSRCSRSPNCPASFGENLTTEGLIEEELHIGDVLRIGNAFIQVT